MNDFVREGPMKKFLFSILLLVGLAGAASAQTNLAGTWQGRLEPEPGKGLVIQFVITAMPGGGYTAIVTSPDAGAIKNVPAKSVSFADNKLTLDVPTLSGGYAGTLSNGVIAGEWSQAGAKLPLSLRPWQAHALTKADIETLRGEWVGKLTGMSGIHVTIVMRFSSGADGALKSVADVPEQGVKDWELKNVSLDDSYLSLEMPAAHAKVTGTLKGDEIAAQWNQLGNSLPITFKNGKYVAAPVGLDLPVAAREQLKGNWTGTLNGLSVRVRFEPGPQGRTLGYFDSLTQKLLNIPISAATLAWTKLSFEVAGIGAKYTADLAGATLTGEWTQPGVPMPLPLVLTRAQ